MIFYRVDVLYRSSVFIGMFKSLQTTLLKIYTYIALLPEIYVCLQLSVPRILLPFGKVWSYFQIDLFFDFLISCFFTFLTFRQTLSLRLILLPSLPSSPCSLAGCPVAPPARPSPSKTRSTPLHRSSFLFFCFLFIAFLRTSRARLRSHWPNSASGSALLEWPCGPPDPRPSYLPILSHLERKSPR